MPFEPVMFDPADHYWKAEDGRVWSSLANGLIEGTPSAFATWTAAGRRPTVWPRDEAGDQTQAALDEVLAFYVVGAVKPASVITSKGDFWRRTTEEEVGAIEGALSQAPSKRLRRVFEAVPYFDSSDPDYQQMRGVLVDLFGEGRTTQLLAAS